MPEVVLKGWRQGLQKVSLTKLLQQQGGLDLKTAKAYTDHCLDGEAVRIDMPSVAAAEALALEISKLGAEATTSHVVEVKGSLVNTQAPSGAAEQPLQPPDQARGRSRPGSSRPPVSDKPILEKLHLRPGHRAIVLNAPASYQPVLARLPEGVELAESLEGQFDFVHYFATHKAELEQEGPRLKAALKPKGLLWVSYPKGKAIPTDLKRDSVAATLRSIGLEGVAQVAIDDVWSALRFKIP